MAKKILIVEDDEMLRELITKKLADEGYQTAQAIDGPMGIQVAKDQQPDLVLLDILMPGMDGFEVLENLKKDPQITNIPVVILSNLWQKEDVERAIKLGAKDYWVKINFVSEEISEKIKKIIGE